MHTAASSPYRNPSDPALTTGVSSAPISATSMATSLATVGEMLAACDKLRASTNETPFWARETPVRSGVAHEIADVESAIKTLVFAMVHRFHACLGRECCPVCIEASGAATESRRGTP